MFSKLIGPIALLALSVGVVAPSYAHSGLGASYAIAKGWPLGAGQAASPPVTLGVLGLANTILSQGAPSGTVLSAITGQTSGSTVTVDGSDTSGDFSVSGSSLLAGANFSLLATGAAPTVKLDETLAGATNSPQFSTISTMVSAAPVTRSIVAQQLVPGFSASGLSNGTDTAQMSRIPFVNASGVTVPNIQLGFPDFELTSQSEALLSSAYQIDGAWLECTAGTYVRLTFNGQNTTTVTPGVAGDFVWTDSVAASVPPGGKCWTWSLIEVASGGKWPFTFTLPTSAQVPRYTLGWAVERGQVGALTNEMPSTSMAVGTGGYFGPAVIRSTAVGLKPVVGILGDSIVSINDGGGDANGVLTWASRATAIAGYPVAASGYAGSTAGNQASSPGTTYNPISLAHRIAWLQAMGVQVVYDNWGTNDIGAGDTLSVAETVIQNSYHALNAAGFKVYGTTYLPRTDQSGSTSTNFTTVVGQTINTAPTGGWTGGTASIRSQTNAWQRAGTPLYLSGYFEAANAVEVNSSGVFAQDGGFWVATNSPSASTYLLASGACAAATLDGVHPDICATGPTNGGMYILRDAFEPTVSGWMATVH